MTPIDPDSPPSSVVEIRKYPNRRYYDSTHSRHLTLEDICALVKNGRKVRVIDSQNRSDITAKVLTQIILELDSPKLELFPVPLLTELIRVNDQLVKGFFEKFFEESLRSFFLYQKHLETQVRDQALFSGLFPTLPDWAGSLFQPIGKSSSAAQPPTSPAPNNEPSHSSDLATTVQALQEKVDALQRKLKAVKPRARKRKVKR